MAVLEKNIQKEILNFLNINGIFAFKVSGGMFQKSGISDIIACHCGKFVAIEVKRPGGKVSPLQEDFCQKVHYHGGQAIIAYSLDDVKKALKL